MSITVYTAVRLLVVIEILLSTWVRSLVYAKVGHPVIMVRLLLLLLHSIRQGVFWQLPIVRVIYCVDAGKPLSKKSNNNLLYIPVCPPLNQVIFAPKVHTIQEQFCYSLLSRLLLYFGANMTCLSRPKPPKKVLYSLVTIQSTLDAWIYDLRGTDNPFLHFANTKMNKFF